MRFKTNSGNTAVYSYKVVRALVAASPDVRELFALSKYGCCRCMKERIGVTALGLLNTSWKQEALAHSSILQVWGGRETGECFPTQYNAILDSNATRCFRLEDATVSNWTVPLIIGDKVKRHSINFKGDDILQLLKEAKRQGVIFARKFRADHPGSMELLTRIQNEQ